MPQFAPIMRAMILRTEGSRRCSRSASARQVAAVDDLTLVGRGGRDLRLRRAERRGQDDHHQDADGAHLPDPRRRRSSSTSRSSEAREGAHRLPPRAPRVLRLPHRRSRRCASSRGFAGVPRAERGRRCDELLGWSASPDAADRQIRKYSKGMQQRLGIAQALVGDPAFVVLDEPMSGLDPVGRKEIRDLILELKRRGKTVFFSTHILPTSRRSAIASASSSAASSATWADRRAPLRERQRRRGSPRWSPAGAAAAVAGRIVAPTATGSRSRSTTRRRRRGGARGRRGGRAVLSLTPHRETLEDFFVRRLEETRSRPRAGAAGARGWCRRRDAPAGRDRRRVPGRPRRRGLRQLPQRRHRAGPGRRVHRPARLALPALPDAHRLVRQPPVLSWLLLRGRCRACARRSRSATRRRAAGRGGRARSRGGGTARLGRRRGASSPSS